MGKQRSEDFKSLSTTTRWSFFSTIFLESMYQEDRAIFFLPPGTKKSGISIVSFAGDLLAVPGCMHLMEAAAPWLKIRPSGENRIDS